MMNFVEEMKSNERRRQLEAIRNKLTTEIEHCESTRDLAPLMKQLTDVVNQLAELPTAASESAGDQIAERRRARRESA